MGEKNCIITYLYESAFWGIEAVGGNVMLLEVGVQPGKPFNYDGPPNHHRSI